MKKKSFYLFLILVFCMSIKVSSVLAEDIEYFDNLFNNSEFTVFTDATYNDSESLRNIVDKALGSYSFTNYIDNNNYISYWLFINNCNYNNTTCNINLNKGVKENDNYTNYNVKTYNDITINFDNNVGTYFNMLDGNNLVIDYDENMFTSASEKNQYISNYLYSFNDSNYISYYYNDNLLFRYERVNSITTKVIIKKLNNILFEHNEEPYSDEFKRLTDGNITIKSDTDINRDILSNYLSGKGNVISSFSIDGNIVNNKVFIKRVNYSNGKTNVLEKHLITLNRDNIDNELFSNVGLGEYADIKSDEPVDRNNYIDKYFNMLNIYFDSDDNTYESYRKINYSNSDFALIEYEKKTNNETTDRQYHKVPIRFIGYSDIYSDEYKNKVGNEITINADKLNLETINSSLGYGLYALGCNNNYSICDIALHKYGSSESEIHPVNIKLNNTISDEFKNIFTLKEDNSIDIIMDNDMDIIKHSFNYSYYDDDNGIFVEYNLKNDKIQLRYSNYYNHKNETHEVGYNILNKEPSNYYSSLIKEFVDVYPGDNKYIWSNMNSDLFKKYNSYNVRVNYCDKEISSCFVSLRNNDKILEVHKSNINIKEGKSKEFNSLFPGDTIKINSVYKDDSEYLSVASMAYLMSKTKSWSYLTEFNKEKAKLVFNSVESHFMNIEFTEGNSQHQKIVDDIIEKFGSKRIKINFDDLEFINNFYYTDNRLFGMVNVNSKSLYDILSEKINNKHISYFYVDGAGGGGPYSSTSLGEIVLFYDGIGYGKLNSTLEANMRNIIYIPDDTEDSIDAYIKAAQKRIDDYLGKNSGVLVSFSHNLVDDEIDFDDIEITNSDGNSYKLNYKGRESSFIIVKDSSKMKTSTFSAVDVNNNVVVESESANYPMNTVVSSEKIDIDKYKEVLNKLGLSEADIIDINLYSPSIGLISDFDSVSFDVSIPIDIDKYNGKKLYAYYIDDNGNIEEHPITMNDFIANFKTNHFSTYIISEKVDNEIIDSIILENNPQTGDNIILYVSILGGSVVAIIAIVIYLKFKKSAK